MGFGVGVFLLAVGAILTFAIRVRVWWIDVDAAGVVLMLSGVAVLAVTAWYWQSRRRPVTYPPVYREEPAAPPAPVTTRAPPARAAHAAGAPARAAHAAGAPAAGAPPAD
jgi:hypothetical protein